MTIEHVADGKSLTFALEKEVSKTFLELAIMCKAVICCRCHQLDIFVCFDDAPQVAFLHCRKRLSSN